MDGDFKNKHTKSSKFQFRRIKKLTAKPVFGMFYALFAVAILMASTVFWTVLSAKLQSANADQLVNTYLFMHPSNLNTAIFPGSHSMIFKWPLFWLLGMVGLTNSSLIFFTMVVVLITVGALAAIIYSIERRPLVFGTICLSLASCLMLVPAQPHAGDLLPVNMAMLATRNLEYVLYIACIFLFVRSAKLRNIKFWVAVIVMGLLIASDRLFLVLSLGGALIALVVYALAKGWNLVSLSGRWVIGTLGAAFLASTLAALLSHHITNIVLGSNSGPYGLTYAIHDIGLGIIYALLGLLTNFGANPALHTTVLRDIPHDVYSHLFGVSGLSFIVNAAVFMFGIFAAWHLVVSSIAHNKKLNVKFMASSGVSIMLIWTTLAALAAFIFTNHYYAGDARYLTIALFAVFISIASFTAQKKPRPEIVFLLGLVITTSIILAIPSTIKAYDDGREALTPANSRNMLIAQALKNHPVDTLVGDYWRVIPTKMASNNKINILPLEKCTQPRDILSSKAWQINMKEHSFAYLLNLDSSTTNFPKCNLGQITDSYGQPNSSVLIAGSFSEPKEMLLFYDHGAHKINPSAVQKKSDTVLPVALANIPHTQCLVPTIMNIVAHEDDDLLFMNPDLLHDLKGNHCIRTVYVTAGDAGNNSLYWLSRELGSEAAYSYMLGVNDVWDQRTVMLNDRAFITLATPKENTSVSLIYMHLPDGNLKGQGFATSQFESLAKLESGDIKQINSVDGQSTYTSDEFLTALTDLMHIYQPAEIRTQANYISPHHPDHSDHMAAGRYAKKAYSQYENQQYEGRVIIPMKFYIGYPIHDQPQNVDGDDLFQKEAAFATYSKFDHRVCQSMQRCMNDPSYGFYLKRQYQNNE
jgi:LmbE family N-acetylglucosaminyl deacetylase